MTGNARNNGCLNYVGRGVCVCVCACAYAFVEGEPVVEPRFNLLVRTVSGPSIQAEY
jgi:hypothetical protein